MSARPDPERRSAHYEYAWDVPTGRFYATIKAALADQPASITDPTGRLLAQLRYDDDGSLIGQARPVRFRGDA